MDRSNGALARAEACSPFLSRQIRRYPQLTELLLQGRFDAAHDQALVVAADSADIMPTLRLRRGAVALTTAIADLSGAWTFDTVTRQLSDFADSAVEQALAAAFAEQFPGEEPRGFVVLALGKHGSRELNYSSDIDPILLFDPATLPERRNSEPVQTAVKLARRMTEILSTRDGDGYVFRVDLRLRPSPEATPIALPIEAAISYYESTAMGWEQAAFIRARVCAGDRALGDYFLQATRPFVWRRALDFGAIDGIIDISRRIRDHYANGQAFGLGYDLKRGRGGIREVEFFAQVHQLIHGGRKPDLRPGATREALRALAEGGIIDPEIAQRLDNAYVLLRTIEHRVQMIDDRQTHQLPTNADALDCVARLHGMDDGQGLLALLHPHVEWVGANYDQLSPPVEEVRLSTDDDTLTAQIAELGFADPSAVTARVVHWRSGSLRALRSTSAREALETLMPSLLAALARSVDPMVALNRLDDMIGRLPTAINFFKLLLARPALLDVLTGILGYAPTLAAELSRRSELLDGLIDATAFDALPSVDALAAHLGSREAGDDYQLVLDRVRQRVAERRFALGVQVISTECDVIEAGRGYARLAEAAVQVLAQATLEEFAKAHGHVPGGELVILALGRLGGGMLTHASDLDLIFLFTGNHATESDGDRPLGATQYFNRLGQRVCAALSVPTASGPLYEIDTRLRPFGSQGLLAASVDSFERYQTQDAWTWEHLALTRARPIFGSPEARAQVAQVIAQTLTRERDTGALTAEAVKMRSDIASHKAPAGPLDVKLVPGGLVDVEFLTHVTQFRSRSGFDPDLDRALAELVGAGHLSGAIPAAYDLLTRYLVVSRLVSPTSAEPPASAQTLVAQRCGRADWPDLLAAIDDARQSIGEAWRAVVADVETQ